MTRTYEQVIKYLMVYLLCSFVFGICKAEVVIQYFPKDYAATIRISSYASIFIGNAISIVVLFFLLSLVYYLSQYLKLSIPDASFADASTSLISLLIFTEMVKLILVFLFLREEAIRFNFDNLDFQSQLANTSFYRLAHWANTASIPMATVLFFASLYKQKVGLRSNIICSVCLLVLLTINMLS